MTKDTLRNLSAQDLTKLIELLELEVDINQLSDEDPASRIAIEEQIFDELEEVRKEREEASTLPVQYQDRKYAGIEDLFGLDSSIDFGNFEFPELYNVTRIMLMLRDPEWAFAYWDISLHDRNRILEAEREQDLCLVLQEISEAGEAAERLEVPVSIQDTKWYMNIPRRGTRYYAFLGLKNANGIEEICRSGAITVPKGAISPEFSESATMETELVLAISAIQDLGVSSYEALPERLLKYRDEEQLY